MDTSSYGYRRPGRVQAALSGVKPWYFLAAALVSGIVCVAALRANNLEMVRLRSAVFQADKTNGDVETALRDLRIYVYGHMNTDLAAGNNVRPPIQLQYTYDRLVSARNAGASAGNEDIYNQAQKYCEKAIPNGFSGKYRLSCIQSFVRDRSLGTSTPIPKNLYQFDFVSPKWSPDLAGWSLLVTAGLVVASVIAWFVRHLRRQRLS